MSFELQPELTGKLIKLRPLKTDDYDSLFKVASDPLIWEQHPNNDRYKPEVFRSFFNDAINSGGALVVIDLNNGNIIGSSRYHGYNEKRSEIELGWTFLARKYWGGIYNGEMKRLMINHAFRFVDNVIFKIGPVNYRSRKAVEKIGAVFVELVNLNGKESVIYKINKQNYLR